MAIDEAKVEEDLEEIESPGSLKPPEEIVEKYRTSPIAGGNKLTKESVDKIRHLYGIEGFQKKQISSLLGVGMNIVEESTKGVPKPPPIKIDVSKVVPKGLSAQELKPDKPRETPGYREHISLPAPTVGVDVVAALYMLAVGSGFDDLDDFVKHELIPWYGVKIDWQNKTRSRMSPRELAGAFDIMARKAVKFDSLVAEAMSPE